jgi:hypothetical protein
MAEKSGFETLKTGSALLKKRDVCGKGGAAAVIKFCVDIGKTPTDTHKFLKQSEKHSKVSRSLIFMWHTRFADEETVWQTMSGKADHLLENPIL